MLVEHARTKIRFEQFLLSKYAHFIRREDNEIGHFTKNRT